MYLSHCFDGFLASDARGQSAMVETLHQLRYSHWHSLFLLQASHNKAGHPNEAGVPMMRNVSHSTLNRYAQKNPNQPSFSCSRTICSNQASIDDEVRNDASILMH